MKKQPGLYALVFLSLIMSSCSKDAAIKKINGETKANQLVAGNEPVNVWITTGDKSKLLQLLVAVA